MFRCRAQTFSERLGWEVVVRDGCERDRFDNENPLYLVSANPRSGEYRGSLRLLPTTGPNMLRDVFPALLKDDEAIESATIWECSRICSRDGDPGPSGRIVFADRFVCKMGNATFTKASPSFYHARPGRMRWPYASDYLSSGSSCLVVP